MWGPCGLEVIQGRPHSHGHDLGMPQCQAGPPPASTLRLACQPALSVFQLVGSPRSPVTVRPTHTVCVLT